MLFRSIEKISLSELYKIKEENFNVLKSSIQLVEIQYLTSTEQFNQAANQFQSTQEKINLEKATIDFIHKTEEETNARITFLNNEISNIDLTGQSELEEKENDLLQGAPPCLKMLAKEGIPNGSRNNAMYNFGVYVKKRFPDSWDTKIFNYNEKFCEPPLDKKEIDALIKSIDGKDYQYKCKDEPIASFCNSKLCMKQEFGVGDDFTPGLEIKEIQKYTSNPPIFYVTIGEDMVEIGRAHV